MTIGAPAECSNVDECAQHPCDSENSAQICQDTEGSFLCKCDSGFAGQDNEGGPAECININECDVNFGICGDSLVQNCVDTYGGFQCSCAQGKVHKIFHHISLPRQLN